MKPVAIALSEAERRLRGREGGGDVTNVQYNIIWNCHYEPSQYKGYILILKNKEKTKMGKSRKKYFLNPIRDNHTLDIKA
jgi:hypothetical protein